MITDFEKYLEKKIKDEIGTWDISGIYAVYVGVSWNNAVCEPLGLPFLIDIGYARSGEKDWHLACSNDFERPLFETAEENNSLREWLTAKGVENIGIEDESEMYDDMMMYIGKGPAGMYETMMTLVSIFRKMFDEGFIKEKFGKNIPVIFDDLETAWYCVEATEKANPDGLAGEYLKEFRHNRKNSPAALGIAAFSFFMMSFISVIVYIPCTFFSVIMTLIAGGVHFPFTAGGIVKIIMAALSIIIRISYTAKMLKRYSHGENDRGMPESKNIMSALRMNFLFALDAVLCSAVIFSCNFTADRLIALVMVICFIIYSVTDRNIMKRERENLKKTRGKEISDSLKNARKGNYPNKDFENKNDKQQ